MTAKKSYRIDPHQYNMTMLIMVTSAEADRWPDDVPILDIREAGLLTVCLL